MAMRQFVLALMALSLPAVASTGMAEANLYLCDADRMAAFMAQSCAEQYPRLSNAAAEALRSWRARNAVDAQKASAQCQAERHDAASSAEELRQIDSEIDKLRAAWMERYKKEVAAGEAACARTFEGMKNSKGDIKAYLK